MKNFMKKYLSYIIISFILIQPLIDLITGVFLHLNINFTISIIYKFIFLLFIIILSLYNNKKYIYIYLIYLLFIIIYSINILLFKNSNYFIEIKEVFRYLYYPILLISLYNLKEYIHISKLSLIVSVFIYILLIFVPNIFNIGYSSYAITKVGSAGFYYSANEISGIISLISPLIFLYLFKKKNILFKIIALIIYLYVIVSIGTKTPLLVLLITMLILLIYFYNRNIKLKNYKYIFSSFLVLLVSVFLLIIIIPKSNFYKNINTHLDYLEVDEVSDIITNNRFVDHFIFSERLTFLTRNLNKYNNSNIVSKMFGLGFVNKNNKYYKLVEMDYFDILFNLGFIGFIIYFIPIIYIFYKLFSEEKKFNYNNLIINISIFLIIILSFFTGHIITSPTVSIYACLIIIISFNKKGRVLITSNSLCIGGIEISLVNLLNNFNYDKYDVDLVLEKKEGILLNKINNNVNIYEYKLSYNKFIIFRKIINYIKRILFNIYKSNTYDFSCSYATYSKIGGKLALYSSINSSIYIHSSYQYLYNDDEYMSFFDKRDIRDYKNIFFVSGDSLDYFKKMYNNLEDRLILMNNFIDIDNILEKSKEKINYKKDKLLFCFVGRLDDSSKKLERLFKIIKEIDSKLLVIGDGCDKDRYIKYVSSNNLDKRIEFLGEKDNPYPYINLCDYLILVSEYEGFPVVFLEGILLNKMIISTIDVWDEYIKLSDYGYIISKDDSNIKEVKNIISKGIKKYKEVDFYKLQKDRMKRLENIIDNNI